MSAQTHVLPDRSFISSLSRLRFLCQNVLFASSAIGLLIGGVWVWAPFVIISVLVNAADELGGSDKAQDVSPPSAMHAANLYVSAGLLALNATLFAYYFRAGDPLGLVALLKHAGVDFDAARRSTSAVDLALALLAQGFNISVAMSCSHELLHCTGSRIQVNLASWIAALAFDPWFMTHHVSRHHRHVGLPRDHGTAFRGMSVYGYMARSIPGHFNFVARFEKERLSRKGLPYWSLRNRVISGWLILFAVAAYFLAVGGPAGLLAFLVSGAIGRVFFEAIVYVQHYGLLRVDGEPVTPRLSWDVYRVGTNALLNGLGRHADHHDHPLLPSVELKVNAAAPELPYGYMKLIAVALLPPLFFKVIQPHLDDWDRKYATDADIAYMKAHGVPCVERLAIRG